MKDEISKKLIEIEIVIHASSFHIMLNISLCFSFNHFFSFVSIWLDNTILFQRNVHSLGREHLRTLFRYNWLQTCNFTCSFHFLTCFICNYPDQSKLFSNWFWYHWDMVLSGIRKCYCNTWKSAEYVNFTHDCILTVCSRPIELFISLMYVIIKFGYNARCHWLKERALWEFM